MNSTCEVMVRICIEEADGKGRMFGYGISTFVYDFVDFDSGRRDPADAIEEFITESLGEVGIREVFEVPDSVRSFQILAKVKLHGHSSFDGEVKSYDEEIEVIESKIKDMT